MLGVNLALLLTVYAIALICTLCGSDFFLLKFYSDDLQRIEDTLRSWNVFPLLQIAFKTSEATTQSASQTISAIVRVPCGLGASTIQLVNSGIAITTSNITLDVVYLG